MNNHVIGISGIYGSGKSTTAVIMGQQLALATGASLFSNFPMRGAYLFDDYTDWYTVAHVHGSVIIFDESKGNFDGRKWNTAGQIDMTHVIDYVRKMNCIFIFILPNYGDLESRIRNVTDILIDCSRSKSGTIYNYIYNYRDKTHATPKGRLLNIRYLPLASQKEVWKLKLFNTHSMVSRFPTPPQNKVKEFFEKLSTIHEQALRRVYGTEYTEIETLEKGGLLDVVI